MHHINMNNFKCHNLRSRHTRAFTLIEVIVASSLFVTVLTMSATALVHIIDANNKAQTVTSVINNLSFALEDMSRRIRIGYGYSCDGGGDCAYGDTFSFNAEETIGGPVVEYTYSVLNGRIMQSVDGATAMPVTSPDVTINSLRFSLSGSCPRDGASGCDEIQPRVLIVIKGEAGDKESLKSDFVIQTSVTMRGLDDN